VRLFEQGRKMGWTVQPIFLWSRCPAHATVRRSHKQGMADIFELTEQSLAGLGVELVDVERAGGGLLRITIDRDEGIRIEDCEAVSKQLSRVFEVENIDYSRLEVGSPGTDRPLRRAKDFIRFAGERAEVKLRIPFNGRKVFTGTLVAPEVDDAEANTAEAKNEEVKGAEVFGIEFEAKEGDIQVLNFTVDELERAKLDPVLNFRGKK
jgi:ribosome maturation factor RimP